jgi:hypothetical protein
MELPEEDIQVLRKFVTTWSENALMKRPGRPMMKLLPLASVAMIAVTGSVTLAAEDNPTIDELLKTGWQIAGYSQAFDNRSTFILFRNPAETYLVQCRVGYDVTRTPSTYTLCYKLR